MIPLLEVSEAVKILKRGGLIAYPTETFYGLGCDATRREAVQKLFELKGRPSQTPIPVLIESFESLSGYVKEIPSVAGALAEKFWPGPLTLIFKAKGIFSPELLAGTGTVALRVSSHPLAGQLVKGLGLPLTTTSANRSGGAPAVSIAQVERYFSRLEGIVDGGDLPPAKGSTIVDLTNDPPRLVREGEISRGEIKKVIPNLI